MGNENGRALSAEEIKSREAQANATAKQPKGNAYKLKVVIKGDRNTGKTCLWNILQRKPFLTEYLPTSDSQFTHINWEYKASYDTITVEVWDVVDKTKRKVSGLKVAEGDGVVEEDPNVMRGVHAVVFVVDPTKKWTFDYVLRELPKVPAGLSTLLLANFKDQSQKWAVTPMEMRSLIESAGPHGRYLEVSLANSFGLKGLQLFLNLPFLRLRHAFYEQQIKKSQEEMDIAYQEFDYVFQESDYEKYIKWLAESKKTQVPVAATPAAAVAAAPKASAPVAIAASPAQKGAAPAAKSAASSAPLASPKPAAPSTPKAQGKAPATPFSPSTGPPSATQKSPPKPETPSSGGGFFSRLFGSEPAPPPPVAKAPAAPQRDVVGELKQMAKKKGSDATSIDDFKPDVGAVDDFFGPDDGPAAPRTAFKEESSDDDDDDANELVARDEDAAPKAKPAPAPAPAKAAAKPTAPAASAPPTAKVSPATAPAAAAAAAAKSPATAASKPAAPALSDSGRVAATAPAQPKAAAAPATTAPARSGTTSPPAASVSPSVASNAAAAVATPTRTVSPPAPATPVAVAVPTPARPSAVDDFRPDEGGADEFFASPAPAPAPKPAAPKAAPAPAPVAAKAPAAPAPAAPAPAPTAPRPKFEESDSDDEVKPNPFLIPDEDVGDDSVAVQKRAAEAALPKPSGAKSLAPLSWRQPAVEAKPAPPPQPKIAIDISALVAGFTLDDEPAATPGFESIPEEGSAPAKPKKAGAKKKKAAPAAAPVAAEGAPAPAPKKKAGVKKKKAAAAAAAAAPAEEDE